MSESAHTTLQTIAAIAIYVEAGMAKAVEYLVFMGWTTNEAFDLINQYEDFREQIKAGRLG